MTTIKKCCVRNCENTGGTRYMPVLHRFPNPKTEKKRFKTWVLSIGGDIAGLSDDKIYKLRKVCSDHFEEKYQCRFGRISKNAIPTRNLTGFIEFQMSTSAKSKKEDDQVQNSTDVENSDENDVDCTELEYLEEDAASDTSDVEGSATIPKHDDNLTTRVSDKCTKAKPQDITSVKIEHDLKVTIDEIDFLFLSYAKTFKTLAKQFQTMLKLDIAKLFARYEMKNDALNPGEQPKAVEVEKPPSNPSEEKSAVFVPTKEKKGNNKRILKRVPLETGMADMPKVKKVPVKPIIHDKQVESVKMLLEDYDIKEDKYSTSEDELTEDESIRTDTPVTRLSTAPKIIKSYGGKQKHRVTVKHQEISVPDLNLINVPEPSYSETIYLTTNCNDET